MAKQQVTRKRTLPRRKRSDGIDPRILALGAGAGAAAGAGIARATTGRAARKSVAKDVAKMSRVSAAKSAYDGLSATENTRLSAKAVNDVEYAKMPRVDKAKLATYKTLRGESPTYKDSVAAQKMADMSNKEYSKYSNKIQAKTMGYEDSKTFMRNAADIRAKRTIGSRTRKGAALGASAATVAMIVSQVLKELNKK